MQVDLGLRCLLTKSDDTVVYVDKQKLPRLDCKNDRGVTIHRKYGSPRYEAGGSVHGPFLVILVRFGSPKKISSKDKIKKKNIRETA